jgi:hypothetical protein
VEVRPGAAKGLLGILGWGCEFCRVGRRQYSRVGRGRRGVKAPDRSTSRDSLCSSVRRAGKPALLPSGAYCVGGGSSGRPLSVPPESVSHRVVTGRHPPCRLSTRNPDVAVDPEPPRLLAARTASRSSRCSDTARWVASSSRPDWVPDSGWSGDEPPAFGSIKVVEGACKSRVGCAPPDFGTHALETRPTATGHARSPAPRRRHSRR